MKRDHRPYYVKQLDLAFQRWYVRRFLRPQFEYLGDGFTFLKPWHVQLFQGPICLGEYADVIATRDLPVRLTVWPEKEGSGGGILIGRHALISPGVRISSASEVTIGDSCMFASSVYVTDSDWHGIYDRTSALGHSEPVRIGNNVWVGDSAIICKGVTIGDNSVVGAGSVVAGDVPSNVVVAGNPARIVRDIDPDREMITRAHWFADPQALRDGFDAIDREKLQNNALLKWLRSLLFPRKGD
ncbi:MAG: acyltransferase [Syntrophales bacterium]|nr:acyltransferase [Syntrophales bacterium]